MKTTKAKQGISLIVLVITIIIMIILAGAVVITLSNSGIIGKANVAVNKTNKNEVEQLATLAWADAYLEGKRHQSDLKEEVNRVLESQGITEEDYITLVSTTGVELIDVKDWDHAYTCTSESWSTRIEKGQPVSGDMVCKFYKTGKKVTLSDEILQMLEEGGIEVEPEHDEYTLVVTGEGNFAVPYNEETGEFFAWMSEVMQIALGNQDTASMLGTTKFVINGNLGKIANLSLGVFPALKQVEICDGVEQIEHSAFEYCEFLTGVTIPNSVTSIGGSAFEGCRSLTSVTIPDDVTSIGNSAFRNCTSLTNINIPDGVTSIEESTFQGCENLIKVIIPNSVTSIGNCAFYGCPSLTSITIPNSVTNVGSGGFCICSSLTNITIPNSVTSIGSGNFQYCTNLTNITIPNSVNNIGQGTFWGCSNLVSITIPNSVTSIGSEAFEECDNLQTVNYAGNEEQWKQITVGKNNENLTQATINCNYVVQ